MKHTLYITAIAAGALMLCGCQRESLADAGESLSDQVLKFAPTLSGGSVNARSRGTLFNEDGSSEQLGAYVDTFMVAAWNTPDGGTTSDSVPVIPVGTSLGNCVTASGYQKVARRDSTGGTGKYWMTVQPQTSEAEDAPAQADDEYLWKSGERKTFYACANLPESGAEMALLEHGRGQTLTYTVPEAASAQNDILLGFYTGEGKTGPEGSEKMTGTASIKFYHPLTAVRFVKGAMGESLGITSIILKNVAASGTATMDKNGAIKWGGIENYNKTVSQSAEGGLSVDATSKLIGEPFVIIPQNVATDEVTVTVTLTDGTSGTKTIPAGNWQAGKTNTYTVNFTGSSLSLSLALAITAWGSDPHDVELEEVLPDLLPGQFSVSATEYVQFSKGNLQYLAGNGTYKRPEWRFAEHQYDCIGNVAGNNVSNTNDYRSYQADWIDLFGWGATGHNSYGQPPYSINTTDANYKIDATASSSETLTRKNGGDWGVCMGDDWRILSKLEMEWLIGGTSKTPGVDCRTSSTINGVANARFLRCKVNGVNGLIIFPDVFTWPADVSAPKSAHINVYTLVGWASVTDYQVSDFEKLESAGAVFLPASCGYRDGRTVNNGTSASYYWLSTASTDANSYFLRIDNSNGVSPAISSYRHYGRSVRLVQSFERLVTQPKFIDLGFQSDGGNTLLWCDRNVVKIDNGVATLADNAYSYNSVIDAGLFTWEKANSITSVDIENPDGLTGVFRLPTKGECDKLKTGMTYSKSSTLWAATCKTNGNTIVVPFSGYVTTPPTLIDQGSQADFWTSVEASTTNAYKLQMTTGTPQTGSQTKTTYYGVRLVFEVIPAN